MFFPAEPDALSPLLELVKPAKKVEPKRIKMDFDIFASPAVTGFGLFPSNESLRILNKYGELVVMED